MNNNPQNPSSKSQDQFSDKSKSSVQDKDTSIRREEQASASKGMRDESVEGKSAANANASTKSANSNVSKESNRKAGSY